MKPLKIENVKDYVERNTGLFHKKRIQGLYCGRQFREFISDDNELFLKIIEPLGYRAQERNDEFERMYSQMINKFTREFSNSFCSSNGAIDWRKLVSLNSAITAPILDTAP